MSLHRLSRILLAILSTVIILGTFAFFRGRPADTELAAGTLAVDTLSRSGEPSTVGAAAVEPQPADAAAGSDSAAPPSPAGDPPAADRAASGSADAQAAGSRRLRAGEDPDFAAAMGWPVKGPPPLPGAVLPDSRIVCYYGNPNSTRMGALGEYPKDEMLRRLRQQIDEWRRADPATPVKPCLHMVAVVAQGEAGTAGHYRSIMRDADVQKVYDWSREIDGIFIVDIQVGTDDIRRILPRFDWIVKHPDVHVGVDPEFYMKGGERPGSRIGTMDAADINYMIGHLSRLVREHGLPPKVLVVHRFTQRMVTNADRIRLDPNVQVVMHMDGWGPPWLKRDSYRDYVVREPVQYPGFKLFYHNDTKQGDPLMTPQELLRLQPVPIYIQYQ
jgi:hypothetical protein